MAGSKPAALPERPKPTKPVPVVRAGEEIADVEDVLDAEPEEASADEAQSLPATATATAASETETVRPPASTEPKAEPEPEPEPAPQAEAKSEPEAESRPERPAVAEPEPEPEPRPQPKPASDRAQPSKRALLLVFSGTAAASSLAVLLVAWAMGLFDGPPVLTPTAVTPSASAELAIGPASAQTGRAPADAGAKLDPPAPADAGLADAGATADETAADAGPAGADTATSTPEPAPPTTTSPPVQRPPSGQPKRPPKKPKRFEPKDL